MLNTFIKAAIATFILLTSFNTYAALIEQDWQNPGDGLLTRDTQTGLEWLDLTQTAGFSINEILGGTGGWIGGGFTYATDSQVGQLFLNSDPGNATLSTNHVLHNFNGAALLLSLLGCTEKCGTRDERSFGISNVNSLTNTPTSGDFAFPVYTYQVDRVFTTGRLGIDGYRNYFDKDIKTAHIGHFLIRESSASVPEPSSLALLFIGLLGLNLRQKIITSSFFQES